MRHHRIAAIAAIVAFTAYALHARASAQPPQSLSPAESAAVESAVKAFAQTVAHDVTHDGPLAWRKYLEDSPAFFMAVNGAMAFPDSAATKSGLDAFAPTIKHIELKWGDDLRVDPLTPNLAVVAATYHELQVPTSGQPHEETGFFTGLAELQGGRWQFRDAHWSQPLPAPPAK
jgi:hypothetical protein